MTASRFSGDDIAKLWHTVFVTGDRSRLSPAYISKRLGVPMNRARWIVTTLIEIGAYNPATRYIDTSRLPPMKGSDPYEFVPSSTN